MTKFNVGDKVITADMNTPGVIGTIVNEYLSEPKWEVRPLPPNGQTFSAQSVNLNHWEDPEAKQGSVEQEYETVVKTETEYRWKISLPATKADIDNTYKKAIVKFEEVDKVSISYGDKILFSVVDGNLIVSFTVKDKE